MKNIPYSLSLLETYLQRLWTAAAAALLRLIRVVSFQVLLRIVMIQIVRAQVITVLRLTLTSITPMAPLTPTATDPNIAKL